MGENGFLPYLMFFGGLILLIWILMRRNWRGQMKAKKDRGKDSYLVSNPRPQTKEWTMSGGPAELNKWQVEMLERTRELQAEVDTKLLILQRTLLKIEAAHLPPEDRHAVQETITESRQLVDQGPPKFSAVSELLCDDVKRAEIYALADEGQSQAEIAQQMNLDPYAIEMILNLRDA
ncbi:hypothetical protein C5Y96_09215 [Blastopirellula marina]|uniref:Uncharacterized protein n=1 Tax=Blastopirellula marina TaxID=124 RepID=A0A2S8FUG2_9BACT|nr:MULTISPECIES: hypothetical protein [Pirellulaceae]PQO35818.1 hypothetical protein C5Y96_09215 [Blastopirellula marina]RCS53393.1 hypothetical protein DTL36_09225 [Bremerella cremea]